ncbi:MAG: ABC transporter ATP-binding protein [Acidimicrobiia bacterium]|nr:ABC transporter ATP-binding protein [Acidimicrobiia bacterium]NNC41838.1 ABC transporter ATP-binding protein [Acidimicrobiia bacterium]NND12623.1 ABC transporter ATP-binding protein [Acidimicrobiia bacterium]NNL46845.1 ABC transporter ATP-binding protein [Acidimicrobiia bacterium]
MTKAIITDRLTKHYGETQALIDLDLEVELGEVFGFLGPNGAGKTTMIRTILDLIYPTYGTATLLGKDSHQFAVELRNHVGYLPGDLELYPTLTGRETLTYFANLRGGVDWTYVDHLADRLDSDLTKKVRDLSSGNKQKVGLIQAFMNKPDLLILDEPSSGLDPLVQQEFQAMLREIAAEGRTVFLSSHTLSEVERVADRVAIIRHGRLVVVERIDNLKTKAIRRLDMEFGEPVSASLFESIDGVRSVEADTTRVSVSYEGAMKDLLHVAMGHDLINLESVEADLEEIFLTYYRDTES